MKRDLQNHSTAHYRFLSLILAASLALPLPSLAASVALATSPLATSTTSTVQPNLLFVLDDSGSMSWTYMPDTADNFRGEHGYQSSQCNGVYFNPNITYLPPLDSTGTSYANASFTAARDDGFDSTSTARNLNSEFTANRFSPESANTTYQSYGSYTLESLGPDAAHYRTYSGTQTTKNYNDTGSTFYTECDSIIGVIANNSSNVFTKISLSSTAAATTATIAASNVSSSTSVSSIKINGTQEIMSGASAASTSYTTVATNIAAKINACTSASSGNCTIHGYTASTSGTGTVTITGLTATATTLKITKATGTMTLTPTIFPIADSAKLQNFANWYSYYRTRMQMMKSSAGHAFSSLNDTYRVGLMKINSSSTPALTLGTFETTQRTNWYSTLYNTTPSGSTPLRTALANAGRYYAGQLSVTDPVQYSCQQNFSILSTDGYWNDSSNPNQINGSTDIGNQDGTAEKPMYDGSVAVGTSTVTINYTRNDYSCGGCTSSTNQLRNQPQIGSCTVTVTGTPTGTESCTPGSWSNNGSRIDGACVLNTACTASIPSPDPSTKVEFSRVTTTDTTGGSSNSLADVAMYYYQTDLRTSTLSNCTGAAGVDVCENNVFIGSTDNNVQQHMTTFTLGLGASGYMRYSSSYLSDSSGDYISVKLGSTASAIVCTWQTAGTTCSWPIPSSGTYSTIDDLWHAAVNGRGAYFSATDPTSLAEGLSGALAGINTRKGAAAAAATSTLNPVDTNNFSYVASYTTVAWKGNLEARGINTDTGVISENASLCVENVVAGTCAAPGTIVAETSGDTTIYNCVTTGAVICTGGVLDGTNCKIPVATACTGTMNAKVSDASDTRTIKTANSTGTALINFDAAYAAANPTNFDSARISTLSQWTSLDATQQTAATGINLVNYLRGQYGYEDRTSNAVANRLYRYREAVLGDALESQPTYISKPVFSYPYAGYAAYKTAQTGRAGVVYIGTNNGMMHAFDAATMVESWAYVPSMVIPNMWKLADTSYATLHRNFVNGTPVTTDICTANCGTGSTTAVWKTILVGGLNGGGRGYYALDITVPTVPVLLWEFTPTNDSDLGYSFGVPVVTRKTDGTWVVLVTSGYDNGTLSSNPAVNNSPAGSGIGYLYVLNAGTGAIISKISTGVGDAATPSGLAKIAGWNTESAGNLVGYVYGGDLLGNVWRFDINSAVAATIGTGDKLKFATLFSDAGGTLPQPITTTPVLGKILEKRVVFIGTGKYLETSDLSNTQVQTQYAIKDDDATTTLVNPRTTLVQQTLTNNPDGTATRLGSSNAVNFSSGRGWYVDFPDSKERANIDSKLVQGTLLVPTIVPSSTVCSPGGYGWLNYLDYLTGGAVDTVTGLASIKYDSTIVGINVIYIGGVPIVAVVTSTNPTPKKDDGVTFKAAAAGFTGQRVIWRELIP